MERARFKPNGSLIQNTDQPLDVDRYLVQCKLTSKSLGIPSGIGPMESMYLGDYNGYFLVTNSILTSDHTALLEKIRNDPRFQADWWMKDQIEERLKSNFDLLVKYSDIVVYQSPNKSKHTDSENAAGV